jgi:hypothetical protein
MGRRRGSTTYLARQLGGVLLERQAHALAMCPVSCIAPAPVTSLVCHAVTSKCGQRFSRCNRQRQSQASGAAKPACLNVAGSPRRTMIQRVHQGKLAHCQAHLGGARTQLTTGRHWLRRCRRALPSVTVGCTRTRRAGAAAAGRAPSGRCGAASALPGPRHLHAGVADLRRALASREGGRRRARSGAPTWWARAGCWTACTRAWGCRAARGRASSACPRSAGSRTGSARRSWRSWATT